MGGLSRQAAAVSLTEVGENAQGQLWEAIASLTHPSPSGTALVCKAAVLPSQVPTLGDQIETRGRELGLEPLVVSHLTAGIVYSVWQLGQDSAGALGLTTGLRQFVTGLGGSLTVEACPLAVKEKTDIWGEPAGDFPLMQRIKEQFDPRGIINPGRFLGGL